MVTICNSGENAMTNHIKCTQCDGGWRETEPEDRVSLNMPTQDACYHCGNTGYLSAEAYFNDLVEMLAESLATYMLGKLNQEQIENPDGEDWAFQMLPSEKTEPLKLARTNTENVPSPVPEPVDDVPF